jgi:hypothetical protein
MTRHHDMLSPIRDGFGILQTVVSCRAGSAFAQCKTGYWFVTWDRFAVASWVLQSKARDEVSCLISLHVMACNAVPGRSSWMCRAVLCCAWVLPWRYYSSWQHAVAYSACWFQERCLLWLHGALSAVEGAAFLLSPVPLGSSVFRCSGSWWCTWPGPRVALMHLDEIDCKLE